MSAPYAVSIPAVRAVRNLTGLSLRESLAQVRAIVSLANVGTLLPGEVFMDTPLGLVPLSEIYAVVGVDNAAQSWATSD
jgi:hypothetical protein